MQNAPPTSTCLYSTLWSWNGRHAAASPANMKPRHTPYPSGGINGQDSTKRPPLQNGHTLRHRLHCNHLRICDPWKSPWKTRECYHLDWIVTTGLICCRHRPRLGTNRGDARRRTRSNRQPTLTG